MVTDMNEAIALTHVHPRYHDIWIGGHVREHSWAWEHTGEALSSTPSNKSKFPPWITFPQRQSFNCLSLHNHASSPKFIESKCAKRMGYACEEG
ncbi:unnamed protein product, partial [Timema podura]|nr:unnamed protein product [Timema podura]